MATLLIESTASAADTAVTRFGGLPSVPQGGSHKWPACRPCGGAMRFLGQLRVSPQASGSVDSSADQMILLFMCPHNPGCCDEWDSDLGGNMAIVVPLQKLGHLPAPASELIIGATLYGARFEEVAGANYEEARSAWVGEDTKKYRQVLGQLFGEPFWIQGDQTAECDSCRKKMRFVAQLEEGPDMNFGGGCAYIFDCACAGGQAKMLWQCG